LGIVERSVGRAHATAQYSLNCLGIVSALRGRTDEAAGFFQQVIDNEKAINGARGTTMATREVNLAEVLIDAGRAQDTLEAVARAEAAAERAQITPQVNALLDLLRARASLLLEQSAAALPLLESAAQWLADNHAGDADREPALFALAQALWRRPADRPRALRLAQEAEAIASRLPAVPAYESKRKAIRSWLADREPRHVAVAPATSR
jgi:hypothetical protein